MLAHCMAMPAQCTPVHSAVCMRNEKAVRTLLSLRADLDVRSPFLYSLAGAVAVEGLGLMETPLNPRRLSFGIGMDVLSELKALILKPSSTSQKALDTRLVWVLVISWTSSWPNVLLSVRVDKIPNGNGLSKLGPELIVLLLGKALPVRRLKKGNGSKISRRIRIDPYERSRACINDCDDIEVELRKR
jgi:hypothetical protein